VVVLSLASTVLAVEAGVVLSLSASHTLRTLATTKAKAAASPRERLAAASAFMAATIDDNGIFGGPHVIVVWSRQCKTSKKYFRYVQKAGVNNENNIFEKTSRRFNHMGLFLTSRVTKRSKLSAIFFLMSLLNPLRLTKTNILASGVLLLEQQLHIL